MKVVCSKERHIKAKKFSVNARGCCIKKNQSMMARVITLAACLLVAVVTTVSADFTAPNIPVAVQIGLRKQSSMQAGRLGQPVTSYLMEIEMGNCQQTFQMLVDVNAREIWLPEHKKLALFSRLNYKNGYKRQETSRKEQGTVYKTVYNDCELTGEAYWDDIRLLGYVNTIIPRRKFPLRFLVINCASNDNFKQFSAADGVMAFSPWPLSESGSELTLTAMKQANLISELVFSLELDSDLSNTDGGELSIGGVNPTKFVGQLKYHQLISSHFWEIGGLDLVMLGANSIDACQTRQLGNASTCSVHLSTTSNDIYAPTEAIKAMLKLLNFEEADRKYNPSTLYEIDCLRVATAPSLTFVIEGAYYTVPPTSYIRKKVDGYIFKSSTCYVAMLPSLSDNKWRLGTNFLANYYTVFDMDKRAVAFGKRRE